MPRNLPMLPLERQAAMDRDLMEIDVPHLQQLYATHRYTVSDVTRWYLTRIARYNPVYKDLQTVDVAGALATAAAEDRENGASSRHGLLWGVPIVIKANTAVKGLPDTDGWAGFALPGHEFIAPRDATVVARLRAAGAVILGITNMPDFAASDTNRSTAFGRTGNAYDVRFSPGGSSGGTVTAVTSNEAMLGNGTDTGNSIRMPAGTSSVVGVFPTRGLVSIAGIAPLDWLLDNTGPIARNVTDAAIALTVMSGNAPSASGPFDPQDAVTADAAAHMQPPPYTQYLQAGALKGRRFGVPAFVLSAPDAGDDHVALRPETRAMLMKTVDQLRSLGAEVVIDPNLLPLSFEDTMIAAIKTAPYRMDGTDRWLAGFGPAQYRTPGQYAKATGHQLPAVLTGPPVSGWAGSAEGEKVASVSQAVLAHDPEAEVRYFAPRRAAIAAYVKALDDFHLDGLVYPSAQMPPPDETMPQDGGISGGPHSETGWVNKIGIPAIVLPAGYYPSGLPFGLEISARPWRDGDLIRWAYSYEQATHLRRPPVLVHSGLLGQK